ncbi:MAG: hypothetical protein ACM30E_05915 [Nitrososphaerales archaeon]
MNKRITVLLVLCLLLIASVAPTTTTVAASPALDEPPPLPQAFYGTVRLNEQPAPVGTRIEVRGPGVLTGIEGNPLIVTVAGHYGSRSLAEPRLVVQGNVAEGAPLAFYIDGMRAQVQRPNGAWQLTFPFEAGALTELNLRAPIKLYLPFVVR